MEVKENKIGKNEVKFVVWSIVLSFMMIVSSVLSMFMVDRTTFMSEIEKQIYAAELTYNEFNSSNKFVDGTNNNVSFEAYFVADRNNDGIAEKLDGAAVNSNTNARLYIDLGVNENGYIKDGVIEFSSNNNFNYGLKNYTSQFLKGVYNSDKINKINLKNIEAGTEFLLDKGLIGINLHNNINNYHFDNNSVKFKATYVPDVGPSVQIEKNINLTVDWYGTIETSVESSIDSSSFMRFVDGQNLENISRTVPVPIYVKTKGNLLLKDNIVRVKIGELNGYKAENVTVTSNNNGEESSFGFVGTDATTVTDGTAATDSLGAVMFSGTVGANAAKTVDATMKITNTIAASSKFNMTINGTEVQANIATAINEGNEMKDAAATIQTAVQAAVTAYNTAMGTGGKQEEIKSADFTVTTNKDGSFNIEYAGDKEISFSFGEATVDGVTGTTATKLGLTNKQSASATSNKGIELQIGANEGQTMEFTIDDMSAAALGVDGNKVDLATQDGAQKATTTIDAAIKKVSAQRSKLGAVQNRLEHTIANLDTAAENTQTSESRIRDTDMAEEMVAYSKNNILLQAGQSMLAQANQSNQGVLSLLQ